MPRRDAGGAVDAHALEGLGRASRMNTPGTPSGNWAWRVSRRDLSAARARQLHELLDATDRLADR